MIEDRPASVIFFELPKDWEDKVKQDFAEGLSDVEVFVNLGVSRIEHEAMLKDVVEYRDAFDNGMAVSEAYWMRWARTNMVTPSKDLSIKLFEKFMQRCFSWDIKMNKEEKKKHDEAKEKNKKKEVNKFTEKYIKIAK